MKTSEFIQKVNEMGFGIKEYQYCIKVTIENMNGFKNYEFGYISTAEPNHLEFKPVNGSCVELFDLMIEYTKTPIEEREETPKYILVYPKGFYTSKNVLTRSKQTGVYYDLGMHDTKYKDTWKCEFTEQEIKEIPFDTAMFTKERVN
jgi:hypothetical protein